MVHHLKATRQALILLLAILTEAPILSAQSKHEDKAEVIRKTITSKEYKIDVNTYLPPYKDPILLDDPDSSIEIKNDSIFSNLIYLGKTEIPYKKMPLIFKAPIEKYSMHIDKKGNAHILFSTTTAVSKFDFKMNVHSNGSASIYVVIRRYQSISFSGELNTQREYMKSM